MQSDPECFSKEERQKYHLAQRVYASTDWKDTFGSWVEEFSIRSEELKKGAEGYQKLVGKELMKRRPRGFTEGTTNTSAG
jgi:hypothetical protein